MLNKKKSAKPIILFSERKKNMSKNKVYVCRHCENIVNVLEDGGGTLSCCGEEMTQLAINSPLASKEKHLPTFEKEGDLLKVVISSIEHPMTEEHKIEWIFLETECGGQIKRLSVLDKPVAEFNVANDKPLRVYAYCNLHGLWMTEV